MKRRCLSEAGESWKSCAVSLKRPCRRPAALTSLRRRPRLSCLQHNWVSRRADQGPKTIEQIHKEAKIEEQEEQRKVHQQLLAKDSSKRRPGQTAAPQILFRA